MQPFLRISPVVLVGVLAACSSSPTTSDATDPKKTDAGAASAAAGNAAVTSSPLLGTWDIALVANGDQSASVMTLTTTSLSFAGGGSTLTENFGGDFVTTGGGATSRFPTTHTIQKLDTGDFPYALGGTWTFNGGADNGCAATVADGAMTVKCTNLGDPLDAVFTPSHAAETTTFTRSSTLTSRFGALGGAWHLAGPTYNCDAKFEGSSFDATCAPNDDLEASVVISITFGNGIASGKIDGGELSAKKR